MIFDTPVAIAVRDDLPVWEKLNVTAFLATGIAAAGTVRRAKHAPFLG
jgi:hypothetical protein